MTLWLIGLLLVTVSGSIALISADNSKVSAQETKVSEVKPEAEAFEAAMPNFANLTFIRAGVYDSGTGTAVVLTSETSDASKALVQLIGRRQCWRDEFPERFKRMSTESLAHRTVESGKGNGTWGNTLPYAFVINYSVD